MSDRNIEGLTSFVKSVAAASKKLFTMTAAYMDTATRLSLVNNGMETQAQLQDRVFKASIHTSSSFESAANAAADFGLHMKGSFPNNEALVGFSETVTKSLELGGMPKEDQQSFTQNLSKGMGSGFIGGDLFASIISEAPEMADAIVEFTGVSREELTNLANEGQLSADTLKNAMFAASGEINERFSALPDSFSDVQTQLEAGLSGAFAPLMDSILELVNTPEVQEFIEAVIMGFQAIGEAASSVFNFLSENWTFISSMLQGALLVAIVLLVAWIWAMVPALWSAAAAMMLPLMPLLLIIAAVGLLIWGMKQAGITAADVFGFIGGVVGGLAAILQNVVIFIKNRLADIGNYIGNMFAITVATVKRLFIDMCARVLDKILALAHGIENILNKIPGIELDLTSGMTNLRDKMKAESKRIKDEAGWKEYFKKTEYVDVSKAYDEGSEAGKNFYDKYLGESKGEDQEGATDLSKYIDKGGLGGSVKNPKNQDGFTGVEGNAGGGYSGGGNGGGGAALPNANGYAASSSSRVSMKEDSVKYLREAAERDYAAKVKHSVLAPNITVTFGDVRETADVDKVQKRIAKILREEIAMAGEG